MRAYVGQTRAADLMRELREAGIGEATQRGQLPPRRSFSWFYDNGAFGDHVNGLAFDAVRYTRDLVCIRRGGRGRHTFTPPDFVTLPDRVADWPGTVRLGREWLQEAREAGAPLYVVLQDGATPAEIAFFARVWGVAGVFVGGSLDWKIATGARWVQVAHDAGIKCHIGRVGTPDRVAWARDIGADSIDSSFPLWDRSHLAAFLAALGRPALERFPLLMEADQ